MYHLSPPCKSTPAFLDGVLRAKGKVLHPGVVGAAGLRAVCVWIVRGRPSTLPVSRTNRELTLQGIVVNTQNREPCRGTMIDNRLEALRFTYPNCSGRPLCEGYGGEVAMALHPISHAGR